MEEDVVKVYSKRSGICEVVVNEKGGYYIGGASTWSNTLENIIICLGKMKVAERLFWKLSYGFIH